MAITGNTAQYTIILLWPTLSTRVRQSQTNAHLQKSTTDPFTTYQRIFLLKNKDFKEQNITWYQLFCHTTI